MDFTVSTYHKLLDTLLRQGFSFQSFFEFLESPEKKVIILRHDVDLLPLNSLEIAKIEAEKGIKGTYYFRIVPESFDEKIIKEIHSLGHEVGYHYEDLSLEAERQKTKNKSKKEESIDEFERYLAGIAIKNFEVNLEKLRKTVPVKTICMHGSPLSRWDSRLLWNYYDYHDFGIVGEPYFDIDFNEVPYLTDTGRRWDGDSFNVRDKAQGSEHRAQGKKNPATSNQQPVTFPKFHSTSDIIRAAEERRLPDKIMMTFHPQRWTEKPLPWIKELILQNIKNVGKYFLIRLRH